MRGSVRLFGWALLTVSAILAAAGAAGWWLYQDMTAPGPLTQKTTAVIPPHTPLGGIAALLAEKGVIRHALAFEVGASLVGQRLLVAGGGI